MKIPTLEKTKISHLTSAHTPSAQNLHDMCVDLANRYNELDETPAAIIFTTLAAVFAEGSQNHFAGVCGEFSRFRLAMMMAEEMGIDPKELLEGLNGQSSSE